METGKAELQAVLVKLTIPGPGLQPEYAGPYFDMVAGGVFYEMIRLQLSLDALIEGDIETNASLRDGKLVFDTRNVSAAAEQVVSVLKRAGIAEFATIFVFSEEGLWRSVYPETGRELLSSQLLTEIQTEMGMRNGMLGDFKDLLKLMGRDSNG
jgi:hypothetical protein